MFLYVVVNGCMLGANQLMANHLVIGLGGTGGRIICEFRKKIYEDFRAEDPKGVNLRYLYVDSSDELMKQDLLAWKVLGRSVQLKKDSQLLIKGMGLNTVLNALSSYPGISPWLGDREQFKSILGTMGSENIFGGQKRRLGRFLFACKAPEFRKRVQDHINDMERGGTVATTFHICCGLAGGTGSGTVVDVISQLRDIYPHEAYRILVYAFLPEEYPHPSNKAKENFHANGYAALAELNALAAGVWQPHDVSGAKQGRLQLQSPFNCCYLFTDVNEAKQRVDVDNELWGIVANFLYQKIVAAARFTWKSLTDQENYENCQEGIEAEKSSDEGRPERSRLFFSFGIKQIAYPEEEIREYLTYSFARQAGLQLRYNNWDETFGYLDDEPKKRNYAESVKQDSARQRWKMTDEHLTLSQGILPDEINSRQWKPIGEFWQNLIPNLKTHVRENTKDRKGWNDALKRLCATAYGENYRSLGVQKFYEIKQRDLADECLEIRRLLETDMFEEWRNGSMAMGDISRLLDEVIHDLETRKQEIGTKIERARENAAEFEGLVAANDREWAKVGFLSGGLGKYDRLFDAQGNQLRDLYALRTRLAGLEYAKRMLDKLNSEVQSLNKEVGECAQLLADCVKEFDERMKRRCADEGGEEVTHAVVRFYKPQSIRDFEKRLRLDDALQKRQTAAVRERLTDLLGDERRFGLFGKRLKGVLIEELEKVCEASAMRAHGELIGRDKALAPILDVNVVERLYREYSGNPEALRAYCESIVRHATTFLPLLESEVNLKTSGIPRTDHTKLTCFSILMPEARELKLFAEQLGQELMGATGFEGSKEVIVNPLKKNEITLVTVRNVMPARYAQSVAMLRSKYEARLKQISGTAHVLELHSEGDGSQFPSLFVKPVQPDDIRPYILIAQAIGLVKEKEDPQTELKEWYLEIPNERRPYSRPLGKTIEEVLQSGGQELLDQLQQALKKPLATDYLARSKRDQLADTIQGNADELLKQLGGNSLHKEYLTYVAAADKAEEIVKQGR